jgi:hypothetical protein
MQKKTTLIFGIPADLGKFFRATSSYESRNKLLEEGFRKDFQNKKVFFKQELYVPSFF